MAQVMLAAPGCISVSGDLHFADAVAACTAGNALIAGMTGTGAVEVSLAGLARINSASAAVLLAWQRTAGSAGRTLQIRDVPQQLAGILRLSGLDEVLPVATPA
jgi:ABC-type transporter Mla MlaB component